MKAVVLLSGGLDSMTTMAVAANLGSENIVAVSFRYGSVHNERELKAAAEIVKHYQRFIGVEHIVHETQKELFMGSGSALMGEIPVPDLSYQEAHDSVGAQPTVVPFRNAYFLSIGTILALTHDCDKIFAGVHGDDAHNGAYPDCTPEFVHAMQEAIYYGSDRKVQFEAPFNGHTKGDVVRMAANLGVPLQMSYSCYNGRDVMCGHCATCQERIHAFNAAGWRDPSEYEQAPTQDSTLRLWGSR